MSGRVCGLCHSVPDVGGLSLAVSVPNLLQVRPINSRSYSGTHDIRGKLDLFRWVEADLTLSAMKCNLG